MKEITKALKIFHKEIGTINKDANNPFFKSKYAPLESILPAIKEPLEKAGLIFYQLPGYIWNGNASVNTPTLKTVIMEVSSGEFISSEMPLLLAKQDPQGQGSAITYMRRYMLVSMLGLNCDNDDDGNAASKMKEKKNTNHMNSTDDPFSNNEEI